MKALLAGLVVVMAACGEGRAIFNVDVYSFVAGTGNDTVAYIVPVGITDTLQSPAQKISLPPGFGSSVVDSVRITSGGANLINAAGTGSIGFQLYIAATAAGVTSPSALAINIPPTGVSGAQTVPVLISGDLSPALNDLFTQDSLFISIGAVGTNTGAVPVTGDMALTALQIRVVVLDKVF